LTLGTNSQVVLGQNISVNVGPRPITVGSSDKAFSNPAAVQVGKAMEVVTLVFYLAYPCIPDDDGRAALVAVYQVCVQLLLYCLMDFHMLYHTVDKAGQALYDATFVPVTRKPGDVDPDLYIVPGAANFWYWGLIVPLVLESTGEALLDTSKHN
jgi:hypothetical protein